MNNPPSLQEVRNAVVATLYVVAQTLELQIRNGAGAAMLRLPETTNLLNWPDYADFDLSGYGFGVEAVYRYAFHGELSGFGIGDDSEDGELGRLQSLLEISRGGQFSRNFEDLDCRCDVARFDALERMIALASARFDLDNYDEEVSLASIALLGDISERSVRNALHAEGSAMLAAFRNSAGELVVERNEALRWLRGRRNFKETVRVGSQENTPDHLARDEIMPFLNARLRQHFADEALENDIYRRTSYRLRWSEERVRKVFTQPIDELSPDDCPALSLLLNLDTAWLTTQVMRARFPDAMKELQPAVSRSATVVSPFKEEEGILDVTLTDAGIRNGYFNIERRYADRLFPADSFGSRGGDQRGSPIFLRHDSKGSPYETDLRVKSEALVSPRKRFSAYFTAHAAKAGDVIRIKRIDDNRTYELTYLPKPGRE